MSNTTKISWADMTHQWAIGCDKVSRACKNCYAITMARRLAAMGQAKYEGATVKRGNTWNWSGVVTVNREWMHSGLPTHRAPKRIFVNSMGDTFHQLVRFADVAYYLEQVVEKNPWHLFYFLTKRPERMAEFVSWYQADRLLLVSEFQDRFPNVWWGVTVEDQQQLQARALPIVNEPAISGRRWLSCEPLVGALDFDAAEIPGWAFDFVVAGGESGHGAEPSHPDHFRQLRDWCAANGAGFHFKQWGEFCPWKNSGQNAAGFFDNGKWYSGDNGLPFWGTGQVPMVKAGTKAAGRLLDGVLHDATPDLPKYHL